MIPPGCPCCVFDLFLPPSLQRQQLQQQPQETLENAPPSEALSTSDIDNDYDYDHDEAVQDVPQTPQQVIDILVSHYEMNDNIDSSTCVVTIVDTHSHAQLERESDETYTLRLQDSETGSDQDGTSGPSSNPTNPAAAAVVVQLKAIVCAVEPADWQATLDLASKSSSTLPALGIHPWYLGEGLPEGWLQTLERLLMEHPTAMVGEIGLCKMARWIRQHPEGKAAALAIQRQVFQQQLRLAAKLRRPVSVHCVNQHGDFVSVLKDTIEQVKLLPESDILLRQALPPAIAMHSFTGTAHQAKELLQLEEQIHRECIHGETKRPLFYFGFSHTVNFVMNTSEKARRKGREAVCVIPSDRLLVESDVHSTHDLLGGTAGAIAYVAWARNEGIHHVAQVTSQNGMALLSCAVSCR